MASSRFANVRDVARFMRDLVGGAVTIRPKLESYATAGVPDAGLNTGRLIYVTDGASGDATVAFSNSEFWLRADNLEAVDTGA